jgi:hypothetical protein
MRKLLFLCVAALAVGGVAASGASAANQWVPPKSLSWYWQLQGTVKTTGPQANADAFDVDGFGTSAATVSQLRAAGHHTICYISAGTAENWRSDYGQFTSSDLGNGVSGWAGEKWVDTRSPNVRSIMAARVQSQCAAKGFDAVEFDNVDGYDNGSGLPLTAATQLDYNGFLAGTAHAAGLAAFLKNDVAQVAQLAPQFDGAINEQCGEYDECGAYSAFLNADKPVLQAEYAGGSGFCTSANAAGRQAALYNLNLDGGTYTPCFSGSSLTPRPAGGTTPTPPPTQGGGTTPTPPPAQGGGTTPVTTPGAHHHKPATKGRHPKGRTRGARGTARGHGKKHGKRHVKKHVKKHARKHGTKHAKRHAKKHAAHRVRA